MRGSFIELFFYKFLIFFSILIMSGEKLLEETTKKARVVEDAINYDDSDFELDACSDTLID